MACERQVMAARSNRQYILAGSWLLLGVVVAVVIFAIVGNQLDRLQSRSIYRVEFPLTDGAAGLKPGSVVRVGGQDTGRVEAIAFDDPAFPTVVRVDFSLPTAMTLYVDPVLEPATAVTVRGTPRIVPDGYEPRGRPMDLRLEQPILGSSSTINFVSVGWPKLDRSNVLAGAETMKPGKALRGFLAPSLLSQAGLDKSEIDKLKSAFSDIQAVTSKVNTDYDRVREDVVEALKKARTAIERIEKMTADNEPDIRAAIKSAPAAVDNFNATMENARRLTADVEKTWPEWKEYVRSSLADGQKFIATLNPETGALYTRITETLAEGRSGLAAFNKAASNADDLLTRAKGTIAESEPEVRQILASLRLASDQLKLTLAEVRRNPWKMLYQPNRKELQQDLLYMSSRNYADAVSDLRAVATSLDAVSAAAKAGAPVNADRIGALQDELRTAFDKYQAAESELLNRLVKEDGK